MSGIPRVAAKAALCLLAIASITPAVTSGTTTLASNPHDEAPASVAAAANPSQGNGNPGNSEHANGNNDNGNPGNSEHANGNNGNGNPGNSEKANGNHDDAAGVAAADNGNDNGKGNDKADKKADAATAVADSADKGNGNAKKSDSSAAASSSAAATSSSSCPNKHQGNFSGNGANTHGAYDSTCDGTASGNGNGNGNATGKPCAGCVGNADNKNPKGQAPNGKDHNAGYECDRNHGVGRTNPAHSGCPISDMTCPDGSKAVDRNHDGVINIKDCQTTTTTKPTTTTTKPTTTTTKPGDTTTTTTPGNHPVCPDGTPLGNRGCSAIVLGEVLQQISPTPQAQVLGVSQTRPAPAGTLPFTGANLAQLVLAGGLALAIGAGIMKAVGEADEDAVS